MSTFDEHVQEARAGFKTLQEVCGQIMNSEKAFEDGGSMEAWLLATARVLIGIRPILREVEFYVYLKNGQ